MTEEQQLNSILNLKDFIEKIEEIAIAKRVDYIDAVVIYCELTGLEVETAAKLIKSNAKMKARIKTDAENLNYFPKSAKLPL
jgi:hypothetical protein